MTTKLVDRLGRPYPLIALPERRRGVAPANAGKKYPPEVLTPDEVLRLMAAFRGGRIGDRNRAAVAIMWRAGLRLQETLDLEPRDLDLDEGIITVREGKGRRFRRVGIDPWGAGVVATWMEHRAELLGDEAWRGRVFITVAKGFGFAPLQAPSLREAIKRAGVKAKIQKRVHPHGLRHAYCDHLLREGVELRVVSMGLGHGAFATTEAYARHVSAREVIDELRGRAAPVLRPVREKPVDAHERLRRALIEYQAALHEVQAHAAPIPSM